MGTNQSSELPAGAPGSSIKSQRDEDIPYTSYSISKPISGDSPKTTPRHQPSNRRPVSFLESQGKETQPKHDIVIVADGQTVVKDVDPELTRLNTIPTFYPIMRGSLNIPMSSRDPDVLDKLDPKHVLLLCLRYQEHLKQLAEAVAFDQNALCIRVKEIDCAIQMLMGMMTERHKRYAKYAEQFQRASETVLVLNRIKSSIDDIIPKMDRLNHMLPPGEQLNTFQLQDTGKK